MKHVSEENQLALELLGAKYIGSGLSFTTYNLDQIVIVFLEILYNDFNNTYPLFCHNHGFNESHIGYIRKEAKVYPFKDLTHIIEILTIIKD